MELTENPKLTAKQQAILDYMKEHARITYPTIREIAEAFGVYPATIQDHIEALERKGFALVGRRRTKKGYCTN